MLLISAAIIAHLHSQIVMVLSLKNGGKLIRSYSIGHSDRRQVRDVCGMDKDEAT